MTYAIIGASAGLGRALAEEFAAAGHDLLLAARDVRDLRAIADNLSIRHDVQVTTVAVDLARRDGPTQLIAEIEQCRDLQGLLLPLGLADDDDNAALSSDAAQGLMQVNLLSVILLTQGVMPLLREREQGVIVGFGSIAAARGRGSNMVYSAAKRGLESWFESLRHRWWGVGIRVQFYVPGYLATSMTFGRKTLLPPASAHDMARRVLRDLEKDIGVSYFPSYWRFLSLAMRMVPWPLFKRLNF